MPSNHISLPPLTPEQQKVSARLIWVKVLGASFCVLTIFLALIFMFTGCVLGGLFFDPACGIDGVGQLLAFGLVAISTSLFYLMGLVGLLYWRIAEGES